MLMLLQEAFSDKFRVVVAHDAEQALKEVKKWYTYVDCYRCYDAGYRRFWTDEKIEAE